ncbi:MAG: PH domain-containing protein [Candidatus Micrarchaeota archaeon]|nr:PH domain-containing protein [Candidatus Micrarchaeota archaeon]
MEIGLHSVGGSTLVDKHEASVVEHLLMSGEKVLMTIKQRKFGPGGDFITPTTLAATERRLIVVYRTSFGIRKYYEAIPYRRITSVRIEHGIFSSSLHLHVLGVESDKLMSTGKFEGVIDGLRPEEASAFGNFINKKISDASPEMQRDLDIEPAATDIFCSSCGMKELSSSKFCRNCGAPLITK